MDGDGRTLEVCREFLQDRCKRSDEECRYAHPPTHVEVHNGRVTCCVDSLRDRCKRDNPPCRYMHPPQHLKDRLLMVGRSIRSNESYSSVPREGYVGVGGGPRGGLPDSYRDEFVGVNPYFNKGQSDYYGSPPMDRKEPWAESHDRSSRSNTLEVCREFLRGRCSREMEDCRYAHPPPHLNVSSDNTVTACMDFIRGYCTREECRYFHAPPHLQSRIKSGGGPSFGMKRKRPYSNDYGNGDNLGPSVKRPESNDLYS